MTVTAKDIAAMGVEEVIAKMAKIKDDEPQNLAAKHFDAHYFRGLDEAKQKRFVKIIATCLANPDSSMGAYAMDGADYDAFRPFFEPLIREYHGIKQGDAIGQNHDWGHDLSCDLGAIDEKLKEVSMRVRVARNVKGFPLPGAMNKDDRVKMEAAMVKAFKELVRDPEYGGTYLSLTPKSRYGISDAEYDKRVAAHQMFKDMSGDRYLDAANISGDWPYGRGMYISEKEDFIIWVGEEDHLRIMSMKRGGDLTGLFGRLEKGLNRIESELAGFAESPNFGYVTSCPTNLGAGMRASLHIKLPHLTKKGTDLSKVTAEAKNFGLAVRGAGGEHSAAGSDGLIDISPSARLGVTEKNIMQKLYDGAAALWKKEKEAAKKPEPATPSL